MTPYRKFLVTFYCSFGAYFVLLVVLYLNGYFAVEEVGVIAENPLASAAAKRTNQTKMGGCASKDKKDKVVENETAAGSGEAGADGGDTANGGGEGCVSNSMVFLSRNKSDTMVDAAVLEKMEAGFAKLAASDSKSLLKKYLTKEVFDALKNKKTSFGSTLLDCVQSESDPLLNFPTPFTPIHPIWPICDLDLQLSCSSQSPERA
ncbi:conserved hypothetical protein [Culex quinquefasciatus]|uniref:Phosphagen kinase N-terminal domain-containing protein n=1 Tax=Culex quinquefasciatus TaxID=7176 RepID=B0XKA3_CULQU|nr:conserved hypothetical protein [Culex quinquefasciatus]|eukprot:XP_001870075.1 conserved hypothetical protein [Culex quinquefasciatus]